MAIQVTTLWYMHLSHDVYICIYKPILFITHIVSARTRVAQQWCNWPLFIINVLIADWRLLYWFKKPLLPNRGHIRVRFFSEPPIYPDRYEFFWQLTTFFFKPYICTEYFIIIKSEVWAPPHFVLLFGGGLYCIVVSRNHLSSVIYIPPNVLYIYIYIIHSYRAIGNVCANDNMARGLFHSYIMSSHYQHCVKLHKYIEQGLWKIQRI